MFDLPLHPKIVHLPMALAVLMPWLIAGIAVAWARGSLPRRALGIALALQLVMAASGFASLRSGEGDEEIAERAVSHDLIHEHEEAGEAFFATSLAVLLLLGAACWVEKERTARGLAGLAFVASLGVFGLGVRAGHLGGELAYRHGAASAFATTNGAAPAAREREPHDDD